MAVLNIVHYGDPILKKVCQPVSELSALDGIVEDMFDSMYEAEGIGLAANQVGLDINLFIIDVSHTEEADEPFVFINGKILESEGESVYQEGCLSIPGVAFDVKRPESILFKYQDRDKQWHTETFQGLLGRAIQHEIDHLNGTLIVDRISTLERMKYKQQLKEIESDTKKKIKVHSDMKDFVL